MNDLLLPMTPVHPHQRAARVWARHPGRCGRVEGVAPERCAVERRCAFTAHYATLCLVASDIPHEADRPVRDMPPVPPRLRIALRCLAAQPGVLVRSMRADRACTMTLITPEQA